MAQIGGYPVYPGGISNTTPWNNFYGITGFTSVNYTTGVLTAEDMRKQLEQIDYRYNDKEKKMTKYYKVLQDTPDFTVGAILSQSGSVYKATNDLFNTAARDEADSRGDSFGYSPYVVENSPTWFERVYAVGKDEVQYLSKADAQAAQSGTSTSPSTSA